MLIDRLSDIVCRNRVPRPISVRDSYSGALQAVCHGWLVTLMNNQKGTPERQRHRGEEVGEAGDKEQFVKNAA